ncbi:MAG: hypothetical protein GXP37_09260 [Chloroflexi bacterium]|nr:hypothetical protein [Chloroflexota bacterium]
MSENFVHPTDPSDAWTSSQTLFPSPNIRRPAIVVSSEDQVHVVWESRNVLYHTVAEHDAWLPPRRLIGGQQPNLALDATGKVNLVFRNNYSGRDEIYHTVWQGHYWSLPFNISHTDGISRNPMLLVAPDGRRHAVWEDETPGYATLYHARHLSGWQWQSDPIPDSNGRRPAAVFDVDGGLHVIYQTGLDLQTTNEIFYTAWVDGTWMAPQRLSDSEMPADRPRLQIDLNGVCHAVWRQKIAEGKLVMYARKDEHGWQAPLPISPPLPHTGSPALTIASRLVLHSAWNDQQRFEHAYNNVQTPEWEALELALTDGLRLSAPVLAADDRDHVHAVWVCQVDDTMWELHYAMRAPVLQETVFLPLV